MGLVVSQKRLTTKPIRRKPILIGGWLFLFFERRNKNDNRLLPKMLEGLFFN